MPATLLAFLRLCLVAGLYNDVAAFAFLLMRPLHHPPPANIASVFAYHVAVALIAAVMFLPCLTVPYWLALAFVYARNEWARAALYVGAFVVLLIVFGAELRFGLFNAMSLYLLGAYILGVAALVCLGLRPSREFLRVTVPAFVMIPPRY